MQWPRHRVDNVPPKGGLSFPVRHPHDYSDGSGDFYPNGLNDLEVQTWQQTIFDVVLQCDSHTSSSGVEPIESHHTEVCNMYTHLGLQVHFRDEGHVDLSPVEETSKLNCFFLSEQAFQLTRPIVAAIFNDEHA